MTTTISIKIQFSAPPQDRLAALKARIMQIGINGTRQGFKFAEAMFKAYPELREA